MSTYTPCFPPSDPQPRQRHLLVSSTSSGTSSGGHASFSARLSKAHLALASVSDYIERPPSPTSAAVDSIHVAQLRRKFRLAVVAAYRDTSSGKWAHVSELARLGCTIGRWQGVCSGSKAPPPSTGDRNDQGVVDGPQPQVNPYPRPPVPIFDLGEIRERVENWKANVVSAPLSQLASQDQDQGSSQLRHSAEEQLSPLNFPTVKRRKGDIAKAMKRKRKTSSDRDYTTSRYFRGDGLADRMSLEAQAVNRDAECVTPAPRSVARRSNAELTPHSHAESPVEDPEPNRLSPTPGAIPENIHQIVEAFLPPSFPSQLQTSTPPPCDRLIKPPVIPRAKGLFLSASLPSPPPFPRSQPDPRSASQPPCTPTRLRHDIPSPINPPSDRFKRRLRTGTMPAPENPPSPSSRSPPPQHRDLDLDLDAPSCSQAPVIDLYQLASQRSRDSLSRPPPPRVFALGSSPMTPRTARGFKGKGRAMTMDIASPSRQRRGTAAKLERALSSPTFRAPPQTQTPPLSPPPELEFTFAPVATSTQKLQLHAHADGSQQGGHGFGLEACGPRGSGVVGVDGDGDVDFEGWVRDVPVVEATDDVGADVGVSVGVGAGVSEEKGAGSFFEGEKGLPDTGLGLGLGLGQAVDEHHV